MGFLVESLYPLIPKLTSKYDFVEVSIAHLSQDAQEEVCAVLSSQGLGYSVYRGAVSPRLLRVQDLRLPD